jgi:hypothetical protein
MTHEQGRPPPSEVQDNQSPDDIVRQLKPSAFRKWTRRDSAELWFVWIPLILVALPMAFVTSLTSTAFIVSSSTVWWLLTGLPILWVSATSLFAVLNVEALNTLTKLVLLTLYAAYVPYYWFSPTFILLPMVEAKGAVLGFYAMKYLIPFLWICVVAFTLLLKLDVANFLRNLLCVLTILSTLLLVFSLFSGNDGLFIGAGLLAPYVLIAFLVLRATLAVSASLRRNAGQA